MEAELNLEGWEDMSAMKVLNELYEYAQTLDSEQAKTIASKSGTETFAIKQLDEGSRTFYEVLASSEDPNCMILIEHAQKGPESVAVKDSKEQDIISGSTYRVFDDGSVFSFNEYAFIDEARALELTMNLDACGIIALPNWLIDSRTD